MPPFWSRFIGFAVVPGVAGHMPTRVAGRLGHPLGLGETTIGVVLTAVVTSLTKLVTSIVAVRRGALLRAVGGIIGGNAFDYLLAGAADISYRQGSIYNAVGHDTLLWISLSVLMRAVLLPGLIQREPNGVRNIALESTAIILLHGLGAAISLAR